MQSNTLAPDGYRYGVMFNDGSVLNDWNGRTQQQRVEAYFKELTKWHEARGTDMTRSPNYITVARRTADGPWERITGT